jgi:hypothetical protein
MIYTDQPTNDWSQCDETDFTDQIEEWITYPLPQSWEAREQRLLYEPVCSSLAAPKLGVSLPWPPSGYENLKYIPQYFLFKVLPVWASF